MKITFPSFDEKHTLPICTKIPVRWGDMDSFGHVNNTVFFRFFEIARIEYFKKIQILQQTIGPILASTSCRFLAPIVFPDNIFATAHVYALHEFGFDMAYALYSERNQRIVAKGEGKVISYNYDQHNKASLPKAWERQIKILENGL